MAFLPGACNGSTLQTDASVTIRPLMLEPLLNGLAKYELRRTVKTRFRNRRGNVRFEPAARRGSD